METFYHIINIKKEVVFSNFPLEIVFLVTTGTNKLKPLEVFFLGKKRKCRFGFKSNKHGTIHICSFESRYLKSPKKFKEFLNLSIISLDSIIAFKKDITTSQNNLTQELIHNLTSLNTHNIQDLFALVPQKLLTENVNSQNEIIKEIIIQKPKITGNTILRQIKNNLAMKIEFSVFEKTLKKYPSVDKEEDYIRDKVLSILQIFILDFDEKRIEVRMGGCEKRLMFDYESLSVSLFYLFDNAIKYSCPKTIFNISFKEETDSFTIHLDMMSLRIEENEVNRLCEKGYRSSTAKKKEDGTGIGMYRLQKTLKLNNVVLEIVPRYRSNSKKIGDYIYEANKFKLKFMNQQNWFEANL